MSNDRLESFAFFALFAGVSVLIFFVFAPFIQILTLAAVFATLLQKPYEKLVHILYGSRSIAAALIVVGMFIFFIVPLFFLGTQIVLEARNIYFQDSGNGANYLQTIQGAILRYMQGISPGFTFDIQSYVSNALAYISNNIATLVSGTLYVVLETFLMLLAFFFFLRDGRRLLASLVDVNPFGKKETDEILKKMHQTIESIVKGTLLVAVIRWILIGISFYFFSIPNVILWGSVGGIVGAVPGLGTPFVFIPAVLYLYLQGNMLAAVGLSIFGLAVIVVVDNILIPYFFGKGLEVPQIFVLFSILGGIIFFGPIGFIMGPLVLSIFLSVLHIYSMMGKPRQEL